MTHAVHSLHAPAIEVDESGNHKDRGYTLPEPLFVAETLAEAEEWRVGSLETINETR